LGHLGHGILLAISLQVAFGILGQAIGAGVASRIISVIDVVC